MKIFFAAALVALPLISMLTCDAAQATDCPAGALGTSRTVTLKRESALYGSKQHKALPLQKNEVILTFDDGPSPENTPLVLKALAAECSKASFFMIGIALQKHPDLAKKVAEAGHTTALHSYSHERLASLSATEQLADLNKAQDIYQRIFGFIAPAYRFPFLEETATLLDALKVKNMTVASIDITINDWLPTDTTDILLKRLTQNLELSNGGMILMHDANPITAKALPALLKLLKQKGYKVVHLQWEKPA
jgi:peptidoglycan/xylan/chitin deacetylase (PgdA/CDA1 family)